MKFGARSLENLNTCHEDLQKIMNLFITRTKVDVTIIEGHRSIERQQELFRTGASTLDGVNKKGKHNYSPSLALDLCIYHANSHMKEKIMWSRDHFSYVAGVIDSCAQELYVKGEITHLVRWGGNWDDDGIIALDHKLVDMPHFELVKP